MKNKFSKFFKLLLVVLFSITAIQISAQLPADMSKVKASDITDAQLQEFVQKAVANGLSDTQIEFELVKRGMPTSEIAVLKSRIVQLKQNTSTTSNGNTNNPTQNAGSKSTNAGVVVPTNSNSSLIFGSEWFSNPSLSFEPDLRIATPKSYVLGPSDKLMLDVYGVNLSQQNLEVSAEGTVNIKYVGPVFVNGLSIDEATKRITSKLTKYYPALANGQTKAQLTLTTIRTIKVMLVGAVKKPGAYSLSSLATLYNALFVSGGPSDNGSFRNIELVRNNKTFLVADLYDFLLKADQTSNVGLRDNDVIRIPYAKNKISLSGEINKQGIFEVKENETLFDVIKFAGEYTSTAYKARITGTRNTDFEKKVIDISKEEITTFKPQNGDVFFVGSIIDRYQNKVTINGAVFKPGVYSFEKNMTIAALLKKAEGLKEDAYTGRIVITRTREDLTKEYFTINISKNNTGENFLLNKNDVVDIVSIFDIKDEYKVTINGAVRFPGDFVYQDSFTLKTLILKAGGFAENATGAGITIARRKKDVQVNNPTSPIVELIEINDTKDLMMGSIDYTLKPFDIVSVKVNPYYKSQINVYINGEVLSPGNYTLINRTERISDLIKRSGGVLYTANLSGARLRRRNIISDDLRIIKKIAESNAKDSSGVVLEEERKAYNEIAIDLPEILDNAGSKADIFLEEGDIIYIPITSNLVSVSGEVFKPIDITFDKSKTLKEYLADAGGTTINAYTKKTFVVYPNGKAGKIKHILLFFKKYPKITAGTKIFVPKQIEKVNKFDAAKSAVLVSALSALITGLAIVYNNTK